MLSDMAQSFHDSLAMRLKHALSERLANIRLSGSTSVFGPDAIQQLNSVGLFAVADFLPTEKCRDLIRAFQRLEADRPHIVVPESNGSDSRIYGADRAADLFQLERETRVLDELAHAFYRSEDIQHFQMAGHIRHTPDNLGSGSGWHRDSPFTHQFKFIIYLNDVTETNGPFQYVPGTHRKEVISRTSAQLDCTMSQCRFSDGDIAGLIDAGVVPQPISVLGRAGTLLVANVKGLHRGKPLQQGERWAVTRYYYKRRIPTEMTAKLAIQAG